MLYVYLTAVGALAVGLAFLSGRVRELPVSEPLLALLLGVAVGPKVLGLVELPEPRRAAVLLEASRLLLAVALMAVALRYPVRDLRGLGRPVAWLLGLVMTGMAVVVAGLGWGLLGLPLALAVLLGACVAPTDPVLASSVVTGHPAERHLPGRLRRLLSMESGANDGLALVLVLLGLALMAGEALSSAAGQAVTDLGVALLVGALLGGLAGRAMRFARRHHDVEEPTNLVFALFLALFVLGVGRLLRVDGVLAVFAAGLLYNRVVHGSEREPQVEIDEALTRYLVLPVFVLLGVALPWAAWAELGWRGPAFAVAVLLLRRPPLALALRRPLGLRLPDAAMLGWFGPIGVSALFYLTHTEHQGVTDSRLWAAGSLVVVASTVAHGVSAAPLGRRYARATGRTGSRTRG